MSNAGTDQLIFKIIDAVDKIWVLNNRDDLENDCIDYVYKHYKYRGVLSIKDLVISFLSEKCADAISEADVDSMAREDQERKATTYDEATQGL